MRVNTRIDARYAYTGGRHEKGGTVGQPNNDGACLRPTTAKSSGTEAGQWDGVSQSNAHDQAASPSRKCSTTM